MRDRSRSSSMRISETPSSSSACDTLGAHSFRLDDPRHGDYLVTAHDERPRLAGRTWDLRVDEHVLDLLRPSGEPIAGTPGPYLKAWKVRGNPPLAPADRAVERDRCALEPDLLVFARNGDPTPEVQAPRPGRRRQQLIEWRRLARSQPEEVRFSRGMELAQTRQDLGADQSSLRVGVGRVGAELEPFCPAVRLRLLTP